MRVLTVVHQRDAGPGVFADAGAELDEWHPPEAPVPVVDHDAVLVLGGAMNVDEEAQHPWLAPEKALLRDLLARRVPVLGVCLGAQLLAEAAGGSARRAAAPEIGWHDVTREDDADPVIGPLPERFEAFQWHSYEALPPPDATVLARSPTCVQAYRVGNSYGIQFHAEVDQPTADGWARDFRSDPDAAGLDPAALIAEIAAKIDAWNDLGRALFARFLAATTRA
jgi:GMP synthase-like glutamine amidotransferase